MSLIHAELLSLPVLLTLSLLCGLAHAAEPAHYLTLYSVPGVPRTDDPYTWSTAGGRQLVKGLTNEQGQALVQPADGEEEYILETLSMRWAFSVPARCWQEQPTALQQCMQVKQRASRYDIEQDAAKLAREKEHQAREAAYRQAAQANDDALAWLGKLPAAWSAQEHARRLLAVSEQIQKHIASGLRQGGPDVRTFACQSPARHGALPRQQAVQAYLQQPPPVLHAGHAWDELVAAAAQGNWMARLEIYYALAGRKVGELSYLEQARLVQLMEWLQRREIGGLYSFFAASTVRNSELLERVGRLAAMQGSVSDQSVVGTLLQGEDDPALVAAGRKMLDCAATAMAGGK